MLLDEARRDCKRLEDARRGVEQQLGQAQADMTDTRIALANAEGRAAELDNRLAELGAAKRDMEFKLCSIYASLKRVIGLRIATPRAQSPGLAPSPTPRFGPRRGQSRGESPVKELFSAGNTTDVTQPTARINTPRAPSPSQSTTLAAEIDPDVVRNALRLFVQDTVNVERDRDDALAKVKQLETDAAQLQVS